MEHDARRGSRGRGALEHHVHFQRKVGDGVIAEVHELTRTRLGVMPAVLDLPDGLVVRSLLRIGRKRLLIDGRDGRCFYEAERCKRNGTSHVLQTDDAHALLHVELADDRLDVAV